LRKSPSCLANYKLYRPNENEHYKSTRTSLKISARKNKDLATEFNMIFKRLTKSKWRLHSQRCKQKTGKDVYKAKLKTKTGISSNFGGKSFFYLKSSLMMA
jgi:hypothetical protein